MSWRALSGSSTGKPGSTRQRVIFSTFRKARDSLGQPLDGYRNEVELALQASHWLGPAVLRPASPA